MSSSSSDAKHTVHNSITVIAPSYRPAVISNHKTQDESQPLDDFPVFSKLPLELRLNIWKCALPGPRIVKLILVKELDLKGIEHTVLNAKNTPSALFYVCHETRIVALKAFPVQLRKYFQWDVEKCLSRHRLSYHRTRINPEVDKVYMCGLDSRTATPEGMCNPDPLLDAKWFSRTARRRIRKIGLGQTCFASVGKVPSSGSPIFPLKYSSVSKFLATLSGLTEIFLVIGVVTESKQLVLDEVPELPPYLLEVAVLLDAWLPEGVWLPWMVQIQDLVKEISPAGKLPTITPKDIYVTGSEPYACDGGYGGGSWSVGYLFWELKWLCCIVSSCVGFNVLL